MKVIVARTAGFCWGVRRAMDAVLEVSSRRSESVNTLGPLIHNPQALELIGKRGVGVLGSPEDAGDGTLVIRAHGIPVQDLRSLQERQRRGELRLVNATCPEVAKVHSRIKKWSPKGYFTVILGTKGHAESTAHQSFAANGSAIVANLEEAKALTDEQLRKVLVVAQTTFTVKDFQEITDYLRSRAQEFIAENTICQDTTTRQAEAKEITQRVDYVVVVGGKTSSNTKHLAELAAHYGKPVQYVETASELDLEAVRGHETVGILAGASTPTWLVEEAVELLEQLGRGPGRTMAFLRAAFGKPLRLALGTACMTLGVHHWMGLPAEWKYPVATGAYVLAMHLLAPYFDPLGLGARGPGRARLLERNRTLLLGVGLASLGLALGLAASLGLGSFLMVALASLSGMAYKRKLRLGSWSLSLQAIPASKDVLVAFALALVAVAVPLWHHGRSWDLQAWAGILLVSVLALARTTLNDLKDMQSDQILGRETLPILIGRKATRFVIFGMLGFTLAAALWRTPFRSMHHPWLEALLLGVCTLYPVGYQWLYHERFSAGKPRFDPSAEAAFYLAGLLVFV